MGIRTTASRVDVFADRKRSLGTVDPFDRELYVGLGCALENLLQAAPAHGYRAKLTLLPTPGQPTGVLTQMTALAGGLPGARLHWFDGEADRAQIGGLMVDAALAITRDDQQSRDSFRLFRSSWDDIQKHKDGLTLDAQGLSAFTTAVAKLLPASDRKSGALAAAALRRPRSDAGGRRVAIALALLIPALVCFTTVGRLRYLPGALLLAAGALVLAGTRRRDFAAALGV